jgi:hypothetical protein
MYADPYFSPPGEKVPKKAALDPATASAALSLRLAAVALLLSWVPVLGAAFGLAGQVHAMRGWPSSERPRRRETTLHPARAGLVLSSIATCLSVAITLFWVIR